MALAPRFRKPDDPCKNCPLYGDGSGFVPDEVPAGAAVIFISPQPGYGDVTVPGQIHPGDIEAIQGRPSVGPAGQVLRKQLIARHLPDSLVGHASILKCCDLDAKGLHSNKLPPPGSKVWKAAVAACRPLLEASLAKAPGALLCPAGDHAIKVLTGLEGKVLHLRGTLLRGTAAVAALTAHVERCYDA